MPKASHISRDILGHDGPKAGVLVCNAVHRTDNRHGYQSNDQTVLDGSRPAGVPQYLQEESASNHRIPPGTHSPMGDLFAAKS